MLKIMQRLRETRVADATLVLPFELRSRSRFRARLTGGEAVGVMLERGQVLRGGDLLLAHDGRVIEVRAALESVSTVRCERAHDLARVAYHLGNRHVALQIGDGWLRYGHDHVLDDMVRGLGARVHVEESPFEPEAGAYHAGGGGHRHGPPHAVGLSRHGERGPDEHGHDP